MEIKGVTSTVEDAARESANAGTTVLKTNRAKYFDESMRIAEDTPLTQRVEKTVMNDFEMAKHFKNDIKGGEGFGAATKKLWAGMVENSGGSRLKAGSRLGAYAAGVAAVTDLLNPLSPGWGD